MRRYSNLNLFFRLLIGVFVFSSCTPATVTVTTTSISIITTTTALTTSPDPLDLSYLIGADPATVDNSQLAVTPLERMHTIGLPHEIDVSTYLFGVGGLVNTPLSLSYEQIKAFPQEDRVVLLICPLNFADNPRWTGVPLSTVLASAGVQSGAKEVVFQSVDGFEIPLPLDLVPDILLAYKVDGEPLPPGHGYPLRAVVKGRLGVFWLRWLTGIIIR